jgi:hypothetical protein
MCTKVHATDGAVEADSRSRLVGVLIATGCLFFMVTARQNESELQTNLDGLREAAAHSDGVTHLAFNHNQMRSANMATAPATLSPRSAQFVHQSRELRTE